MNREVTREQVRAKGQLVSDCMLEQYGGTVLGVGVGMLLGLRTKSLRPFVVAITLGTGADFANGYLGPCKTLIEDYREADRVYKLSLPKDGSK
jgi:hypothetical protein